MRLTPSIVLLAGLVAACASPEPFVDHGINVTLDKPKPLNTTGNFAVCFSDKTPPQQVEQLAQEQCAAYGLQALIQESNRWQCRITSPHSQSYQCINPELKDAAGRYINPFNKAAVANWERVNGKTARVPAQNQGPEVTLPASPAPKEGSNPPPPAPVPQTVLTPADIAGKPALPKQPVPTMDAPPPPPPLPSTSGFSLPQGSWGDHFEQ